MCDFIAIIAIIYYCGSSIITITSYCKKVEILLQYIVDKYDVCNTRNNEFFSCKLDTWSIGVWSSLTSRLAYY